MKSLKVYNYSCIGASHIDSGKVCQDSSLSLVTEDLAIIAVSDGHGGEKYFRSDVGSKLCTQITIDKCQEFVSKIDANLFVKTPFASRKALKDNEESLTEADYALRQLFSSIISTWRSAVLEHFKDNPLTEKELPLACGDSTEKYYGCTLIAYIRTSQYCFGFQIGDGKCVALNTKGWSEPIPWDEKCFLNKTTSICDSSALEEFRYCYGTNAPVAVLIGSDGLDDSFGEMENLADFYIEVAKLLAKDEQEAFRSIEEALPQLSRSRSQDDMSCAILYNKKKLRKIIPNLLKYQIDTLTEKRDELAQDITDLQSELIILECFHEPAEEPINYNRAEYDYQLKQIHRLIKELDGYDAKLLFRKQALDALTQKSSKSSKRRKFKKKRHHKK